jgi:putative ABC transport system permease protein
MLGGLAGKAAALLADGTIVMFEEVGIGAGYLELLGLKPVAGRFFDANRDDHASWVLNESAVRALGFASPEAALGRPLPQQRGVPLNDRIIGVVQDFPIRNVRQPIAATAFGVPPSFAYIALKLEGARLGETLKAVDDAWRRTGAVRPIQRQFYDQHIQALYLNLRRQTEAFGAFSLTAIFIAALGLFGLSAFTAERRTKEIGIRKAMGAGAGEILRLLLWQFARPVLWANLIAWPAAFWAMNRWLTGFAYHIDLQPWMFLAAGAAALAIALATVATHSLLVARTRPVLALRYE